MGYRPLPPMVCSLACFGRRTVATWSARVEGGDRPPLERTASVALASSLGA